MSVPTDVPGRQTRAPVYGSSRNTNQITRRRRQNFKNYLKLFFRTVKIRRGQDEFRFPQMTSQRNRTNRITDLLFTPTFPTKILFVTCLATNSQPAQPLPRPTPSNTFHTRPSESPVPCLRDTTARRRNPSPLLPSRIRHPYRSPSMVIPYVYTRNLLGNDPREREKQKGEVP